MKAIAEVARAGTALNFRAMSRRTAACEMMAGIWRVLREWRVHFEGFGVPGAEIEKVAPAFRRIDDVSTSTLRKLLP